MAETAACTFIDDFMVVIVLFAFWLTLSSLFCFFFLSQRHSFSEDTWVKFSNLSEEKIIGTYDTTAHVSKFSPFFPLLVKAHPRYQRSLLLVPQNNRGTRKREPWERGCLRTSTVGRNKTACNRLLAWDIAMETSKCSGVVTMTATEMFITVFGFAW